MRRGFISSPGIPAIRRKPPATASCCWPRAEDLVPDPIAEDANLLLETPSGAVLVLGCAHGGVLNILDHVKEKFGIDRLHAVLGGTHLMFYAPEQIQDVIAAFEDFKVELVGRLPLHRPPGRNDPGRHFGQRFRQASAGKPVRILSRCAALPDPQARPAPGSIHFVYWNRQMDRNNLFDALMYALLQCN